MWRRKTWKPRQSGQQESNRSKNSHVQEPLWWGYSAVFYRWALDLCRLVFNTKLFNLIAMSPWAIHPLLYFFLQKHESKHLLHKVVAIQYILEKMSRRQNQRKRRLPEWIWLITTNAAERSKNWNTLEIVIKKLHLISKRVILAEGWGLKQMSTSVIQMYNKYFSSNCLSRM